MRSDLVGGQLAGTSSGLSGWNGQAEERPAGDSCSQAKAGVAVGTQSGGYVRGRSLKREALCQLTFCQVKVVQDVGRE